MTLYVQYGCGLCAPDGWINFDASPRLTLERIPVVRQLLHFTVGSLFPANVLRGDIVRGLPLPDGSACAVYCSHVLEHLAREELPLALRNTFSLLTAGGIFRLVVPDLQWRAARYLASTANGKSDAADEFMNSCGLGRDKQPKGPLDFARERFGKSAHLWMYDFDGLKHLLQDAGFTSIRRSEFGDGSDPMFARVEDRTRFFEGSERELAIEAAKPGRDRIAHPAAGG